MTNARRVEAATRVRALHPPLRVLFAALRAELGAEPEPADSPPPAPEPVPEPAPEPVAEAAPEPDPEPVPTPAPVADPLAAAFASVAGEAGGDADDLALRLAVAAEQIVLAAAMNGAKAARLAGVPDVGDVGAVAVDAVIAALQPYAATLVADRGAPPPPGLLERVRAVARSAGVVEAVRGREGWQAVQRFGLPYCSRPTCYGNNGRPLTGEVVAAEGLPPFAAGCNCRAEPERS